MPRGKIIIRIAKNGDTTVKTKGVKGPKCEALTKDLEKALGTTVSSTRTKEWFEKRRPFRKRRQPDGTWERVYLD
jgi:hypothetical protein